MAKFKIENLKFETIMKDYAEIREVTIPDAVMLNARLLCVELARRTQPFGNSDESGKARVSKDIGKIIKSKDQLDHMASYINSPHLKTYVRGLILSGQNEKLIETFEKIGFLKKWKGLEFISSGLNQIHKRNRNSKTGRTQGRAEKLFIASESSLSQYVTEIQKRVGLSKGGWADCASQLKKVNKGSLLTGFPDFVKKAMKGGSGSVSDDTKNVKKPTVKMTNTFSWIDRICPLNEQLNAMNMVSTKMRTQMNRILKKREKTLIEE